MNNSLTVAEQGKALTFTFDDLLRYHGPGFPGGVAHGFKVMEAAFPLLSNDAPLERRELHILTAFPGPGARDAFEMVARTLTDGRYTVDTTLDKNQALESANGRYFFQFSYRGTVVDAVIKPGHVRPEFVALGRKTDRTEAEDAELNALKQEMADRLMALPGREIYHVAVVG